MLSQNPYQSGVLCLKTAHERNISGVPVDENTDKKSLYLNTVLNVSEQRLVFVSLCDCVGA